MNSKEKISKLDDDCVSIRKTIIRLAYESGQSAHLGGSLSMVEILNYIYANYIICSSENTFILSKGHCVLGYYAVLHKYGYISDDKLKTFQTNGSELIAHPVKNYKIGIQSSNGSLGQGLSFGLGCALSNKIKNKKNFVFVLLGDGECNEGSVWESVATASELCVPNLVAIVDENKFRNDGPNNTLTNSSGKSKLADIWSAFGWNVISLNGNSNKEIYDSFHSWNKDKPTVFISSTVKGAGFELMENNNDWHHNRITKKIYDELKDKSEFL